MVSRPPVPSSVANSCLVIRSLGNLRCPPPLTRMGSFLTAPIWQHQSHWAGMTCCLSHLPVDQEFLKGRAWSASFPQVSLCLAPYLLLKYFWSEGMKGALAPSSS